MICPRCPKHLAHRVLKTPRIKVPACPDCGTLMVPTDPERRAAWEAKKRD